MRKVITIVIPASENAEIKIKESSLKMSDLIVVRGKNPSKNRNLGIKKSKTNFIAFTNAHSTLSKDWEDKVINFFNDYKKIDVLGGPQLTPINDKFFASCSGIALSSVFGSANVSSRYNPKKLNLHSDEKQITSANLIAKKKVFKKVLFDESVYPGEDPKFIRDAIKKGFKVAYSPDVIAYNERRQNFLSLAKQISSYGEMRARSETFRDFFKKPLFLIPSAFLIYLLISPTLIAISPAFSVPLIAYIVTNLIFSIKESMKNKLKYVFLLPFIFFTIHISYGAGFIFGKIAKIRW